MDPDNGKKPARVAVVEDDPNVRAALDLLLTTCDYRCDSFACAESFLASPALARMDCVVLDVDLPGADGLAVQHRLSERGIDMPVLFISGAANTAHIRRAKAAGAVAFLEKPFPPDGLLDSIRCALLEKHP